MRKTRYEFHLLGLRHFLQFLQCDQQKCDICDNCMAKFTGLMHCTSTKFKIYAMFYRVTRQQTWREYLVLELARVAKFEVPFLSGAATRDC